jgi:hypothetical protein
VGHLCGLRNSGQNHKQGKCNDQFHSFSSSGKATKIRPRLQQLTSKNNRENASRIAAISAASKSVDF